MTSLFAIGELPDSTLKAKLLANSRRVVFAAPSYFAKYGRPRSPEDLVHHECIVRTAAHDGNAWPFQMNGRVKTVKVAGLLRTNGVLAVKRGGRARARNCQCDAVVGSIVGRSGRCRSGFDTFRAASHWHSRSLGGDAHVAGQNAIVCGLLGQASSFE